MDMVLGGWADARSWEGPAHKYSTSNSMQSHTQHTAAFLATNSVCPGFSHFKKEKSYQFNLVLGKPRHGYA